MASIFTKIMNGEIPSTKIYEDDKCFSILDINPNNKGHALVISKEEHESILDCPDDILKHLIVIAKKVAKKQIEELKCDGINIAINNKPAAGQEVPQIHIHVIPRYSDDGKKPSLGHVEYKDGEINKFGNKLRIN